MTLGGILAILNTTHSTGITLGDGEVEAHFVEGEPEARQMNGDTVETALEVLTKDCIQEIVRGPDVTGTEQAGALRGNGDLKLVVMRLLWRKQNWNLLLGTQDVLIALSC
jgi:hypothetical protein